MGPALDEEGGGILMSLNVSPPPKPLRIVQDGPRWLQDSSRRSKQLKHGSKALVESLEKLEPEDIALKEIIEGKISYQEWQEEDEI